MIDGMVNRGPYLGGQMMAFWCPLYCTLLHHPLPHGAAPPTSLRVSTRAQTGTGVLY